MEQLRGRQQKYSTCRRPLCVEPPLLPSFRLYVLWGFVAVATSVTKVAKRKVSHQLIIKLEFMSPGGVKVEESQSNGLKTGIPLTDDARFASVFGF